jgi:hypothetical protein
MQVSLVAFQRAQKVSAERQRTVVEDNKRAVDEDANAVALEEGFVFQIPCCRELNPTTYCVLVSLGQVPLNSHRGKRSSSSSSSK